MIELFWWEEIPGFWKKMIDPNECPLGISDIFEKNGKKYIIRELDRRKYTAKAELIEEHSYENPEAGKTEKNK